MPKQTFLNLPKEKQERILNAAIEEFGTLRAERASYVKPAYELYKKAPFIGFF